MHDLRTVFQYFAFTYGRSDIFCSIRRKEKISVPGIETRTLGSPLRKPRGGGGGGGAAGRGNPDFLYMA